MLQLRFQTIGQGQKIMGVVTCILEHAFRKRAPSPVRLLRSFRELYLEIALHHCRQTELTNAEKTRGDDGVEDAAGGEIQTSPQQAQIEIGAVQNNLFLRQDGA